VAAWFAFEKAREKKEDSVRVFSLDGEALKKRGHSSLITYAYPHISPLPVLAIENPRLAPQQGLLTLTNLHDVEQHLLEMQRNGGGELIKAYDIPYVERENALRELRLMGITRQTLFPGLDGICSELKEQHFPREL
jgi:hypothetical protein